MSNVLLSMFRDPREQQFVEKLIERTEQKKLTWNRTPTTYETSLKNGTRVTFVVGPPNVLNSLLARLVSGGGWAQFSVRKLDGAEIIRLEGPNILLGQPSSEPFRDAVSKLFTLIATKSKDDLDEVIGELDET